MPTAASPAVPALRDRVKELRRVRAGDLVPNAKNWRVHSPSQRSALDAVLRSIGFAGAVLAREVKRGGKKSLCLIDGHLRAERDPEAILPVLVLDVTKAEADILLATFDPLSAMATADAAKLDALLAECRIEEPDLQEMVKSLAKLAGLHETPTKAPAEFGEVDENINTEHQCPKCGYKWSGGK